MIGGRLVSLAAATTLDLSPADTVDAAANAGFDAAGLWFDAAIWTEATTREVRGRLDATGTLALDIEPIILGPDGDPGDRLIDVAIEVGARHALVACRWPNRPATIERFGELCDRAAAGDLTVVLEFLPIFEIRTLAEALDVVSAAGRPNAGVLVDTLHLARSGGSPDDLVAVDRDQLPYLQLADAPLESPPPEGLYEEAVHGRLLPGEGGLPLRQVLRAIPDVPISVELRSRALRTKYPDPLERAKVVWSATESVVATP
jgi:sugar phosphate isomerase/epimerase